MNAVNEYIAIFVTILILAVLVPYVEKLDNSVFKKLPRWQRWILAFFVCVAPFLLIAVCWIVFVV